MSDLSQIVKAYDVRGVVPDQLDEEVAGGARRGVRRDPARAGDDAGPDRHRPRHARLLARAGRGVRRRASDAAGVDVVDAGLGSTDLLYFASGALDLPGAMFTASHNPAQYNGIKLCRAGARPIGQDTGLAEIRERAQAILDGAEPPPAEPAGTGGATATCSPTTPPTCARWSTCPASGR